ncbi:hypothetical protein CWI38_1030p0010 [Hamiltosporidium tvaerminnensis]|uniref:Uncharacterized protein n=1 Tax=Hamiltosporidium tvaerminnensis TaxID=1176355 RepID=A0A4Q9LW07_9MICR|nr:hypothetical protein CWI38_1030p0010 [Hamiltosporidium tvaerminnensis]
MHSPTIFRPQIEPVRSHSQQNLYESDTLLQPKTPETSDISHTNTCFANTTGILGDNSFEYLDESDSACVIQENASLTVQNITNALICDQPIIYTAEKQQEKYMHQNRYTSSNHKCMNFNCIETKKNIPRNAELILDESTSIIYAEINPIETCLFKPDINPPKLFQAKETLSTHSFTNASETSIETIETAEQQENTLFKQEIVLKYFYLFNVHSERIKSDSDNNLYEIVSLSPPDQSYTELTNQQTPNHTVNSNNESNTQNENSNTQQTPNHTVNSNNESNTQNENSNTQQTPNHTVNSNNESNTQNENSNTQQTPNHTVNSNNESNTQNENSNTQQTPNHTVNSNNESNTQNENSNTQETSVPSLDDHDAFIKWIEEYNFNKSPDPSKITEI